MICKHWYHQTETLSVWFRCIKLIKCKLFLFRESFTIEMKILVLPFFVFRIFVFGMFEMKSNSDELWAKDSPLGSVFYAQQFLNSFICTAKCCRCPLKRFRLFNIFSAIWSGSSDPFSSQSTTHRFLVMFLENIHQKPVSLQNLV